MKHSSYDIAQCTTYDSLTEQWLVSAVVDLNNWSRICIRGGWLGPLGLQNIAHQRRCMKSVVTVEQITVDCMHYMSKAGQKPPRYFGLQGQGVP
jgi:hypothetical protein